MAEFWDLVEKTEQCWLWRGTVDGDGYGRRWDPWARKDRKAHRVAYEEIVGPIPTGLVIDHLCRVRNCVNPAHMEPVTREENIARGLASPNKTHCINGHEFNEQNTYRRGRRRHCRVCNRDAARRLAVRRTESADERVTA